MGARPGDPNRAPAGKARALEPGPGARAAEPPRPGPQRAGLGAPVLWAEARETGRLRLGKEGGCWATKVRSVFSGSFEIALGSSKLSPCDCRVTQRLVPTPRRRGVGPSRGAVLLPRLLPYPPLSHPDLLSLMKQSAILGG